MLYYCNIVVGTSSTTENCSLHNDGATTRRPERHVGKQIEDLNTRTVIIANTVFH